MSSGGVAAGGASAALAEVEALLDALGRALPVLASGAPQDRVADAHRAAHSLKALAIAAGVPALGEVGRAMERVLDAMRFGRLGPSADVIDALAEGIEWSGDAVQDARDGRLTEPPVRTLERLLVAATAPRSGTGSVLAIGARTSAGPRGSDPRLDPTMVLPPSIRSALTEYELSRVDAAVRSERALLCARVALPWAACDRELGELRTALTGHGELIACLPAPGEARADVLELELLVAGGLAEVTAALGERAKVTPLAVGQS